MSSENIFFSMCLECTWMFTEATLLLNGMSSVALCCDLGALHRVICLKDQPYHWHANIIASFLWMLDGFPEGYGCNRLTHCFSKNGSWICWELIRNQMIRPQPRPTELETRGTQCSIVVSHAFQVTLMHVKVWEPPTWACRLQSDECKVIWKKIL